MSVPNKARVMQFSIGGHAGDSAVLRKRRESIRLLIIVGVMAVAAIGWRVSPYRFGVVVGDSMSPSLKANHLFLMEVDAYAKHAPARGDIVVLEWNGENVVKRVVAGPGEFVWLLEYTNDNGPFRVRYVASASDLARLRTLLARRNRAVTFKRVQVPEGHVYVVGDAQAQSLDSRHFGPIPIERIVGKVLLPDAPRSIPPIMPRL